MGLLNIDPGLVIWTIVTFVILLWVLKKFAWKPILSMIEERETTIRASLDEAEKAQAQAEATMQEYQKKLEEARKEAREIISEGKDSAEKIKSEIVAEAQKQKQKMLVDARKQIESEREKALKQIRNSVADIAVAAASRIIDRQLNAEMQSDIIEETMQDFGGTQQ